MLDAATSPTVLDGGGEGADEWLLLVDQVCHGIHHALNNRIGSLSALLELTRLGDLPPNDPAFATLATELTRLEDCSRAIRLLPRAGVGEEPLIVDDVLADVLAVHAYLHDLRDTPFTIAPTRFVEPVRAERWALVRILVLILADAKRLAKTPPRLGARDDRIRRPMGADRISRRTPRRQRNPGAVARAVCRKSFGVVGRTRRAAGRPRRAPRADAQDASVG